MPLAHPALVDLLQRAYSAEMAAANAYIGHAHSLKNRAAKDAVRQIEIDEWNHRAHVLTIMRQYGVPVSRWYEIWYFLVGHVIAGSCHVIGWFMPYFFAGKLESGNVCEYIVMMRYFHELGIHEHDDCLYEMGLKEKEHEVYFLSQIRPSPLLPYFERVFAWGEKSKLNDVDLATKLPVASAGQYCKTYKSSSVD
jgi:hypothetical protein